MADNTANGQSGPSSRDETLAEYRRILAPLTWGKTLLAERRGSDHQRACRIHDRLGHFDLALGSHMECEEFNFSFVVSHTEVVAALEATAELALAAKGANDGVLDRSGTPPSLSTIGHGEAAANEIFSCSHWNRREQAGTSAGVPTGS